jgi:hypothetical protein
MREKEEASILNKEFLKKDIPNKDIKKIANEFMKMTAAGLVLPLGVGFLAGCVFTQEKPTITENFFSEEKEVLDNRAKKIFLEAVQKSIERLKIKNPLGSNMKFGGGESGSGGASGDW